MIIVVTGVIGCGKTSLVEGLVDNLKAVPFYEPLPETDNFMLEAYYQNPEKYSYSMQTLLLALRFEAMQEAQWRSLKGETCIIDSSIYSDKAFLEVQKQCGYVDDLEYRAYEKLCEIHFGFLQYPDIHIHLDLPIEEEVKRIKVRSRDCESGIEVSYLEKLQNAYKDLIPFLAKKYPLVQVDASKSKIEVLEEALKIINNRRNEMEKENSFWPSYKKNTSYNKITD
jgi:deoxyadenosine/deoxycytidine kinase